MENWGSNGISALGGSTVANNIIRNVGNEGMIVVGDDIRIHHNYITNALGWGIDIAGSYINVSNNNLTNVGDRVARGSDDVGGIVLNGDIFSGGTYGCVIDGNILNGVTTNGIAIYESSGYPVVGTVISNNVLANVCSNPPGDEAAIIVIDENVAGGFVSDTVISDNTIYNSGKHGIATWGTKHTAMTGNNINTVAGTGIQVFPIGVVSTYDVTITGNTVRNFTVFPVLDTQKGISIIGCEQVSLQGNIITNVPAAPSSVYIGINIDDSVKNYSVVGNVISLENTYGWGIRVTNSAAHGVISGNTIANCNNAIYYNATGDYLNIVGNDLSNGNYTKINRTGTKTNVIQANNLGVPVPEYANNTAAVAAGLAIGEVYKITAADTLGVVH